MQTRCRTDPHVRSPETSQLQDFIEKVQAEPPKDRPRDSYVSGRTVGWIELGYYGKWPFTLEIGGKNGGMFLL